MEEIRKIDAYSALENRYDEKREVTAGRVSALSGAVDAPVVTVQRYDAPCGELLLGSFGEKLCLCDWQVERHRGRVDRRLQQRLHARFVEGTSEAIDLAAGQLDEYFSGKRREFDIPLLFIGTPFQQSVWNALITVPFGTTLSYAALSKRLGVPKAVRAVANANGANPVSIFVPCHRIIGSDNSLTGYGGGLPIKKFLLELESEALPLR